MMNTDPETPCRCCGAKSATPLWNGRVLDLTVEYFECSHCGYVQTEIPHWLDRAYSDVINTSDTGIMVRNLTNIDKVLVNLQILGLKNGRLLDYAGGYGLLVRLLRDKGIDAKWADPYCDNLVAKGYEHDGGQADLVTAFEVFEHFVDPRDGLDELLSMGKNILFSTHLVPQPTPAHEQWWYYGKEHGQHVGFFRVRSLRKLADKAGKHLVTDGLNYHLMSEKPVNRFLWRAMMQASRIMAPIISATLESRTWADHAEQSGLS